jgi:predicted anti-sigma-YlaC factor YlaD
MLNCMNVTRLYSESQERPLTLKERMSMQVHVMMCSPCRNFGNQMTTLRQLARAYAKTADEPASKADD